MFFRNIVYTLYIYYILHIILYTLHYIHAVFIIIARGAIYFLQHTKECPTIFNYI